MAKMPAFLQNYERSSADMREDSKGAKKMKSMAGGNAKKNPLQKKSMAAVKGGGSSGSGGKGGVTTAPGKGVVAVRNRTPKSI